MVLCLSCDAGSFGIKDMMKGLSLKRTLTPNFWKPICIVSLAVWMGVGLVMDGDKQSMCALISSVHFL